MRTHRLHALIALLAIAAAARAQQPEPPPPPTSETTLSVHVQLVSINALVRDKKGELIHGLTKDDFVLREDGKPQSIRYFNTDSDLPLMLGLMVDTSGSMNSHIADEQAASATFLQAMLTRPQDRAFLVRFDRNVLLLQATTNDVWQLNSALWMLADADARPTDFHARRNSPQPDAQPSTQPGAHPPQDPAAHPGPRLHGGTLLFDGIVAATQKVIGKEPGRRALVVLTDGDDNGSRTSLDDTIRAAQNADVAVYSVLYLKDEGGFGDRGWGHGGPGFGGGMGGDRLSGKDVMERLAQKTGGRSFVVDKQMPITHIFALIEQDMRNQYRIGFTPLPDTAPAPLPASAKTSRKSKRSPPPPEIGAPPTTPATPPPAPRYHTLDLKTRDTHLTVQARTGYFSPQEPKPASAHSSPENSAAPPNTSTNP